MNTEKLNVEKTIAVLIVVAALSFVAYGEFSNTVTGAYLHANELYRSCVDTDPDSDKAIRGTVTVEQVDIKTGTIISTKVEADRCLGSARVEEWGCTPYNKPKVVKRVYCRDGECIAGTCVPS